MAKKKKIVYKIISENCIKCGKCIRVCPVRAISFINNEYIIDSEKCIGCAACFIGCPVKTIKEETILI